MGSPNIVVSKTDEVVTTISITDSGRIKVPGRKIGVAGINKTINSSRTTTFSSKFDNTLASGLISILPPLPSVALIKTA